MGCQGSKQSVATVDPNPAPLSLAKKGRPNITISSAEEDRDSLSALPKEPLSPQPARFYKRIRRPSVSSEPVSADALENWVPPSYPKSDEIKTFMRRYLQTCVLFKHLDEERIEQAIDCFFEVPVSSGTSIIKQGDIGDNFYMVFSGNFEIHVARDKSPPELVQVCGPGDHFGEVALLFGCPRAATVTATVHSVVYALDRISFQVLNIKEESAHRKLYESFIKNIPLFAPLNKYERVSLADAFQVEVFEDGANIIVQGDDGDKFYVVEQGSARALVTPEGSDVPVPVKDYGKGDYFGEIAIITDQKRKATVVAVGRCKCVSVDRGAFSRLLGPCSQLLKRNMDLYIKYEDVCKEAEKRELERRSSLTSPDSMISPPLSPMSPVPRTFSN